MFYLYILECIQGIQILLEQYLQLGIIILQSSPIYHDIPYSTAPLKVEFQLIYGWYTTLTTKLYVLSSN